MGITAQHCRLGLFQDSDFGGNCEDSKSTSERILCIFGSQTCVSLSSMCKNQTSVSHSSTELEFISLDAGLRMDGFLLYVIAPELMAVLERPCRNIVDSHELWFSVSWPGQRLDVLPLGPLSCVMCVASRSRIALPLSEVSPA